MDENNTGDWCAPASYDFLQLPEVRINRGGIQYPMPQLETTISVDRAERWWIAGRYFVLVRQYGEDKSFKFGPFSTLAQAKIMEGEARSWYVAVYNVIIRTYKATEKERTKK